MLKRDNFWMGTILGLIAPILGMFIFKHYKFEIFTLKETFQFIILEPGHKTLTVAMTLSLLLNAVLFTLYINTNKDKTAKGIFATTMVYGLIILILKTFG